MENMYIYLVLVTAQLAPSASSFDPILSTGCTSDFNCTSLFPGSYCDFDRKVDCDEGVCMCKPNLVPVPLDPFGNPENISCLPQATEIHDVCKHDNECIGSFGELSKCTTNGSNSTCECTGSSVYCEQASLKVKGCVRPRLILGDPCDCHSQCAAGIRGSTCANDPRKDDPWRCRCGNSDFGAGVDYIESVDGTTCVPLAKLLGESCDLGGSRQCKDVRNSICDPTSRTCECSKETHIADGSNQSCYAIRDHLGLECSYNFQCPKGSACREGRVCGCGVVEVESKLKPDTCLPQSYLGYECEEDAQCAPVMGPNSECVGSATNKTCQCKEGHFYFATHDIEYVRCYPFAPIGGRCKDRRQCIDATGSAAHTTCLYDTGGHGNCNCTQYYTREYEGTCLDRAHIGQECSSDVQCRLWNQGPALCDSVTKKCVCDDNYVKNLFDNGCDLI